MLISIVAIVSCADDKQMVYNQEAIKLNNRAVEIAYYNPDSALYLLDKATSIDPSYYLAYSNKVSSYCAIKDFENAIKACEKTVKLKPELAESLVMLGMLYDWTRQPEKAITCYQKAIEVFDARKPENEKLRQANKMSKAHVLLLLGDEVNAQKALEELKEADLDDFIMQMLLSFNKQEHLNGLFDPQSI